jgi:hypothetical protein
MIMNEVISWNQIRSEKQRMILISLYVENIGKQYGLTVEERKGLVQNIRIGVLAGYLNAENIEIVGNCIENIYGLEYNKEMNYFEINKEKCPLPKTTRKLQYDDFTTLRSSKETSTLNSEFSDDDDDEDEFMRNTENTSGSKSNSLHSTNSLKKRWGKFLSEIGRK